jgi:N-acetylmuramoyl-L-alanine amidase
MQMESSKTTSTPATKKSLNLGKRTLFNLEIVLGISVLLATLFTAWTPGESVQTPSWEISQIAPLPTRIPTLVATTTPHLRPLIGIVSGHWGNDSGAVCPDGLTEAQINQNIATQVQKKLIEKGFDVDLLKEFDTRLNGYNALALVSIHADSCDYINDQATGYKVAAALASPDPEKATQLTACLRARYGQATGLQLHSTSVTSDMTDYHAFNEISDQTTAAIIETGFLNLDRQFLTEHSDVAAQGIVNGILCFINNEDITTAETPYP